jgi:hypothetical protein
MDVDGEDHVTEGSLQMARLQATQTTKEFEFETFFLMVSKKSSGALSVSAWLKSPRTGLITDIQLFSDEEGIGGLIDDLSETLEIVKAMKGESADRV